MGAWLWIAVGGALGSVARAACVEWVQQRVSGSFPWGTLLVNVVGSLVIGAVAATASSDSRWTLSPELRQFVMVGVLGGFTTFSSFSLQTLLLLRSGAVVQASANVLASVSICLVCAWLGWWLVERLSQ